MGTWQPAEMIPSNSNPGTSRHAARSVMEAWARAATWAMVRGARMLGVSVTCRHAHFNVEYPDHVTIRIR